MVTKCSKEWLGSIVTETLKNGILMPIVTSKESYFYADFKYISFIVIPIIFKFSHTNQKLRAREEPEKICLILDNTEKLPLKVTES